MKHTVKELENCKVEISVDVDSDMWAQAQERAFHKLSANLSAKGFRKGHVPAAMAKKMISQGEIINQAINDVLNPVYAQVLTEEKLNPFSRPDVDITKVSDKELSLVYKVTLAPKVTLGAYTGLTAKKKVASVSEKEITDDINRRLAAAAELVTVQREAKMGDTVVFDFVGYVDGKEFEGGSADNYSLELGSNSFVPGFEEALVGVKAGDSKDVEIVFPKQYVANLAGKPATFKCSIHEVKEKSVPTLSDEAVLDLNIKDVKTVDELKEYEKKSLLQAKVDQIESAYYNAIIDQIVANAKVEIADEIVENEAKQQEENLKKQVESNGLTFQQYLEITGSTEEATMAQMKEQSLANIKRYLVLETLSAKENLAVSDSELDHEIAKMADTYKMEIAELKKILGGQLDQFRENVHQTKLQRFILEKNPSSADSAKEEKPSAKKEAAPKEEEGEKKPSAKKETAPKEESGEKKPAAKKPSAKKTAAKKAE